MNQQAKIKTLVLEQDARDFSVVRNLLSASKSQHFEVKRATTPAQAQEAIERNHYDVCLVDMHLRRQSGLGFLRDELENACRVPIIMLSDGEVQDSDLEAVQIGAADVLVKGQMTGPLLERSILFALERKRCQESLQRRNVDLALLVRAGVAFGSTLDLEEVLACVLDELDKRFQGASSFWLLDPATGELVCRKATGPFAHVIGELRLPRGQGIAGWVVQQNASLIVANTDQDQRYYTKINAQMASTYKSILCVPLRSMQKVIGALQLLDEETDRFESADVLLAESLANMAAIAIENARLFEQAQQDLLARQHWLKALERRSAQLTASEARLRTIINEEAHGVVVLNMEGVIQFINPVAKALFGRPSEELLGEEFGYPVETNDAVELELLLPGGQHSSVEMRAAKIDWDGSPCLLASLYDISARKQLEEALRKLSLRDGLTDLLNQRGFMLMGEQLLAMARRQRKSAVLLFVDMDGMKHINDTLGHQAGDQALMAVARILRESFRGTDVIARLGGDEFVVLALQSEAIGTETMQACLRANVEKENARSRSSFTIELSVGAIICGPKKPVALAEILVMADEEMYRQKRSKKHGGQTHANCAD